jgi:hypothetical protein
MSIEELRCAVRAPLTPVDAGNAEKEAMIEKQLGIQLPPDFKDYWRRYGAGYFFGGRAIYVSNPFSANFQRDVSMDCDFLRDRGEEVPYAVYPESPGLLPWGSDDEGYEMYWLTDGSPHKWPTLVRCREEVDIFNEFSVPMTSFLAGCFSGKIEPWGGDPDLFLGPERVTFNPQMPISHSEHWPATVVQLAEALYQGQDCSFALHDALLEAGHAELASHFQQQRQHPKDYRALSGQHVRGCWALALLLGKT